MASGDCTHGLAADAAPRQEAHSLPLNAQPHPEGARDIYRDTLLRYVAFTSDFGEALKPFVSRRLYLGSYAVVAAYGLADTIAKGREAYVAATSAPRQQQQQQQQLGHDAPQPISPLSAAAFSACCSPGPHGLAQACSGYADFLVSAAGEAARRRRVALTASLTHSPAAAAVAGSAREQPAPLMPVAAAVADTALWHAAASLVIPGVLINRTVWAGNRLLALQALRSLPRPLARAMPSLAGLSLIPLLVPHIDEAVTEWMDAKVRPVLGTSSRRASDHGRQPEPGCPPTGY